MHSNHTSLELFKGIFFSLIRRDTVDPDLCVSENITYCETDLSLNRTVGICCVECCELWPFVEAISIAYCTARLSGSVFYQSEYFSVSLL